MEQITFTTAADLLYEKILKLLIFLGGAIDDFSKDVAKVPYVATVELSGTNGDGYVTKLI